MTGRSGLLPDLLELLYIHRSISRGRHFYQMAQQTRHAKTGEARLGNATYLELGNFFPGSFVAEFLGYT